MTWEFETAVRTMWQEARGEPEEGQRAVAHVIANRLRSGKWGHSPATVVLSPYQFSGWDERDPNRVKSAAVAYDDPVLTKLRAILQAALFGEEDPTGGATHYYAPSGAIQKPNWVHGATSCGQFGNQLFFKDVQ